jgi:ankyrin repeat protein
MFITKLRNNGIKLIQQCKEGNIDAARRLIADFADVNIIHEGDSPLLIAIQRNNVELLDVLYHAAVDIARFSHENHTALMVAVLGGHMEAVRWLLQHQPAALLDARDDLGRSSLILALQNNHLDAAFALLEAGANINLPSNDGTTALTACSDAGMARRLQELTDVNARFEGGMTALLLACKRGDAKMAAMLLDHGADVYDRDDEGMTTLLHACIGGHAAVVELLLKQEPIRLQGNGYECAHGDAEWSEFLYSRRDDGLNALHLAAMGGHAACAQALCGAGGVDVGVPDGNDETALFFADVAVARVLLHAGA